MSDRSTILTDPKVDEKHILKNSLNVIVFKLQVILFILEGTEKSKVAITHLAIGIDS